MFGNEAGLQLLHRHTLLLGHLGEEAADSFGAGRPGQHGVDRDAGAGEGFRQAAGHCQQCGLGGAVMDHLHRNLQGRFTGQEQHPAPATLGHARCVMPRQAHRAHDVDLEKQLPVFIGQLEKALGLEDAEVVDQDVGLRHFGKQPGGAFGTAQVRGKPRDASAGQLQANVLQGLIDPFLATAIDHHVGTRLGQAYGNRQTDTGGGATDNRALAMQ
ncbi:hypothetical protein D3C84_774390 [compost metagenome]